MLPLIPSLRNTLIISQPNEFSLSKGGENNSISVNSHFSAKLALYTTHKKYISYIAFEFSKLD